MLMDLIPMKPFKPLIGLCGYPRTGKDTVATMLIEEYGYRRVALADELRVMALSANPVVRIGDEVQELKTVVQQLGWEKAKEHLDVRVFLQNLGTTMREHVSKDFWIQRMVEVNNLDTVTLHSSGIVVTDIRHSNEIDWLLNPLGSGVLWRVHRPGVGPVNDHRSEVEWTAAIPDIVINNSSSFHHLRQQVRNAVERDTVTIP